MKPVQLILMRRSNTFKSRIFVFQLSTLAIKSTHLLLDLILTGGKYNYPAYLGGLLTFFEGDRAALTYK